MARTQTTEAERSDHLRAWEASGLSARAYGKQVGINPNTLVGWRWQRRQQAPGDPPPAEIGRVEWIELPVPRGAEKRDGTIELRIASLSIRVPDGFEATTLRRVLDVVESRS
ncbi:MAG: hypothetical protein KJZ54_16040 [Phycisphaerales bacterium]|nr:hypothetical protein [Phycisphaerales bacterium]